MPEFDGRPFAAGSMVGIRSFAVDGLGRLVGPSMPEVFTPGENVASCRARSLSEMMQGLTFITFGGSQVPPKLAPVKDGHRAGKLGCSCGFYAYYDAGHNPHHGPENIEAIVEGYGLVTTGTRGFRAEKARLVGLIAPRRPCRRLPRFSPRTRTVLLVLSLMFIAAGTAASMALSGALAWTGVGLDAVGWLAFVPLFNTKPSEGLFMPPSSRGRVDFDLVRRNYPDVPVYRSRSAALRAHPLTLPETPTPDSDADFWTREA
jgi:hypothetical protein